MINIGLCGYGNLGRAVEKNICKFPDMHLEAIFSRREGITSDTGRCILPFKNIEKYKDKIDVLILAAGSSRDLPMMTPSLAESFNITESFDNHKNIPLHFQKTDETAISTGHTVLISGGWDPGLFSLIRLLGNSFIPESESFTFWGKGVSLGHSEAVKKIQGVKDAIEYTIPNINAEENIRKGIITSRKKEELHKRECFVLLEKGASKEEITEKIKSMPDYFKGYETEIHFVEDEELQERKKYPAHGGRVMVSGENDFMEFSLKVNRNADFTASILLALSRAVYVMKNLGEFGAKTIFDIRPKWLIMEEGEILKLL